MCCFVRWILLVLQSFWLGRERWLLNLNYFSDVLWLFISVALPTWQWVGMQCAIVVFLIILSCFIFCITFWKNTLHHLIFTSTPLICKPAWMQENLTMLYLNNEDTDQHEHPRSLISTLVSYLLSRKYSSQLCLIHYFNILTRPCSWAGWFEPYLVRNQDKFSHVHPYNILLTCTLVTVNSSIPCMTSTFISYIV